ncbi:MAG: ThuA domain-containing protein [Phycisphaeraceae bacterium]
MYLNRLLPVLFTCLFAIGSLPAAEPDVYDQSFAELEKDTEADGAIRILLIAGPATATKAVGGHEYFAGCVLLADMLKQTPRVHPILIRDWPKNEKLFDRAAAVVIFSDGGGKQPTLAEKDRLALMDKLAQRGVGIVHLHGAIDYPGASADNAIAWSGGAWVAGYSNAGRGHWDTEHNEFPKHDITRGVTPWKLNDGWLTKMKFTEGMKGVTPLVWSAKATSGSDKGGDAAIAAWAYERPAETNAAAGRAFVFTGIDAHFAWALDGMRQFTVNGILWSAGVAIPEGGAKCVLDKEKMNRAFDKRPAKKPAVKAEAKPAPTK